MSILLGVFFVLFVLAQALMIGQVLVIILFDLFSDGFFLFNFVCYVVFGFATAILSTFV